jgi:hypothetical protein
MHWSSPLLILLQPLHALIEHFLHPPRLLLRFTDAAPQKVRPMRQHQFAIYELALFEIAVLRTRLS